MRRSNKSRRRMLAAVLVAAALGLTTAVATGSIGHGHHRQSAGRFTLHGHVSGLYPGVREKLKIVVHNRGARPLTVRSITTRVKGASADCRARNLRVSAFRGRLRVRAHKSRRVSVKVSMRPDSPAACAGGVFRLAFLGRGRVARQSSRNARP